MTLWCTLHVLLNKIYAGFSIALYTFDRSIIGTLVESLLSSYYDPEYRLATQARAILIGKFYNYITLSDEATSVTFLVLQ